GTQITTAEQELRVAETRLQEVETERRLQGSARKQELREERERQLQARVDELQQTVTSARGRLRAARERLAEAPSTIERRTSEPNPQRAELEGRLRTLLQNRRQLEQQFRPGSEEIRAATAEIQEVETQLAALPTRLTGVQQEQNALYPLLEARVQTLESELEGQEAALQEATVRLRAISPADATAETLSSAVARPTMERDTALENLRALRRHRRDLEIRRQIPPVMARVLERAEAPTVPINQSSSQALTSFAFLAVVLSVGLVLLQEQLDDRINSPDDVERSSHLPVLGHVPLLDAAASPLFTESPLHSGVAEAYRTIRSSVDFAAIDGPIRRLLVTSAGKGEGKSVTSVNLAAAMALNGKRVVLLDGDLRRPSLHRILDLSQERGLSQLLVGQVSLAGVLQESGVPNLRVITSGPLPHNPAELLGSATFGQLLADLERDADVVILDSPPCLPVTDPLLIAAQVDGVLLVLHAGQSRRGALQHVQTLLRRAHSRILGVVLNRVDLQKAGYYYYGRYYGNQYGYGYSHGYEPELGARGAGSPMPPTPVSAARS
ncbi:MAG: polysaccharide biosynthesis tyrosine autokinase, partial [Armatimonadetes bacterium]|nr:polysaccharide biosynthesis tyrosine autokinase [Armatimonadota bacterium]